VISVFIAFISIPIALGFLVAVLVVTLVFLNPFYGLMIYIFLLFARPQDFVPGLERLRIVLVLAVLILLSFFFRKMATREPIAIFSSRRQILMFLLLLIVPLSNIVNLHLRSAWDGLVEFLTAFLLFFIIVNITSDFEKFRKVCWTLIFCTTLVCINGLVQHFRGVDLIGETLVGGRIRWIGIFHDPNDLALLINSFLPFVLVNLFERDISSVKKVGLTLIAALFLMNIYYTGSRGGYIALIAVIGFLSFQRWGWIKGSIIGALLLLVLLAFAPSRMGNLSPQEASASGRIYAWTNGLVMLKTHPALGIGYLRFTLTHGRAAHSAFVACLAELGLIGYFVWLSLLYSSFSDLIAIKKSPASKQHRKYSNILLLSFVGFLASAVFLSQAYNPIFYMLCALVTVTVKTIDVQFPRPRFLTPREARMVLLLIVGSVVAFKLVAVLYT
jgi:O-antigen ligase